MADVDFNADLVVMLDGVSSYQEAESILAKRLLDLGYVKVSYPQAIADREVTYPTGIYVEGLNAAMPHCDVSNVNKAAVCVGILRDPADWRRMDDPDSTCKVSLVTMLALKEAHAHLDMLQKVVSLIQDQDLMKKVVSADSKEGAYELLKDHLA